MFDLYPCGGTISKGCNYSNDKVITQTQRLPTLKVVNLQKKIHFVWTIGHVNK